MYIIKVKGTAKIPDYVQLRDKNYTLVAYFRVDRPEKALEKCGYINNMNDVKYFINNLTFGKITKLPFEPIA
ncbi:MAG: hypothetical protein ACJAZ3_001244 [Sphingobacteriales bacterium]